MKSSKVVSWFVGSFMVPPVTWLLAAWYYQLWNSEEMFKVLFRFHMPLYVLVVVALIYFVVKSFIGKIDNYYSHPSESTVIGAQKSAAIIPWLFITSLPVYIIFGNYIVLSPLEFIDNTEFYLALSLGVPIVFIFSIPFFIMMNRNLEKYTVELPFSDKYKPLSISHKMTILFLLSVIGISFIFTSAVLGVLHSNVNPDELVSVITEKFIVSGMVVLSITFLNLALFKIQILSSIKNLRESLDSMTMGSADLSRKIELSGRDEIGEISKLFNQLVDNIAGLIRDISTASGEIAGISSRASGSADSILNSANTQVESTREASVLMEEILAGIQNNAGNALETEKISTEAAKGMELMNEAGARSLSSIENIASKIKIINDIAFQTNILALNAAVEAASAGVHGKGFSVVASEVKKLAGNSKKAADEIVSLSDSSVEDTERANVLIGELMPDILKTAELVKEISAASQEQNSGVQQVSNVIHELNKVAQENSIASEEISDIAGKLNKHAGHLSALVDKFKV